MPADRRPCVASGDPRTVSSPRGRSRWRGLGRSRREVASPMCDAGPLRPSGRATLSRRPRFGPVAQCRSGETRIVCGIRCRRRALRAALSCSSCCSRRRRYAPPRARLAARRALAMRSSFSVNSARRASECCSSSSADSSRRSRRLVTLTSAAFGSAARSISRTSLRTVGSLRRSGIATTVVGFGRLRARKRRVCAHHVKTFAFSTRGTINNAG